MTELELPDLADEHEALTQFLYLAPVGLAQTTADGEVVMINPISAQLLLPVSPDGGLDNLFTALSAVAPDLRLRVARFNEPSGTICDGLRLQLRGGGRAAGSPQVLSLSLIKLDERRLMAVLTDVTQQVQRERLLRQNEAWFNAIFAGVTDYALVSLDRQGRIDAWNPSIGRVTGHGSDSALGAPYSIFYPEGGMTPDRLLDRLREADQNGWSLDDGWRVRADGSRFWGSAMISPLRDRAGPGAAEADEGDGACYGLVIRDITDKREASESVRLAHACDHLTGLANRRTFFEAAELELARWHQAPRPLALALFDADHFKAVNDRHGHPGGDAVLRHLAALLQAGFREVDVVARIGGEEFAVLLPSTTEAEALAAAERLLQAVAATAAAWQGREIGCTLSGGIAMMQPDVGSLDLLIQRADTALYAAKAAGRNRVLRWQPA